MNDHIRIHQLVEIARQSPTSAEFLAQHLTIDHRETFMKLVKEKCVKVKKEKRPVFKKVQALDLITVMDAPQLAAELAVAISKSNRNHSIAIVDADRFDPRLDTYLNTDSYIKSVYTHLDFQRTTGLNLLVDASHKHVLTKQYARHLAIRVKGCKNLNYFSGSYLLDDYEYYKIEDYKKVLTFLKQSYDTVIISVNKFIYDAFTVHSLMASSCNLIAIKGNLLDTKEKKNYMNFLSEKQRIKDDKNMYILFNYSKKLHSDKRVLLEYLNKQTYVIPYSRHRLNVVNHYYMTKSMSRSWQRCYQKLMTLIKQVTYEFG